MIDDIFADLDVDEEKRKRIKARLKRKRSKLGYEHAKRSLKSEIQIAERIKRFQEPIEQYNPSTMLHALRIFRTSALMTKNIDLDDLRFHHKGITLDGPLLDRLVDFWKDLPENFESQVKSTNLNTRRDSLIEAFDKIRLRSTALLPRPITLSTLFDGKERLAELQGITRKRYSSKNPKELEHDTLPEKANFEARLKQFALRLKEKANNTGYIQWESIFDPDSSFSSRITKAHYLSFLTFSDQLTYIDNGFLFV